MSFDNNTDWAAARAEQSVANHSSATVPCNGGHFLSSPPNELEASLRRRNSLLKSMDLLNNLVLDFSDFSDEI
jgi:hypothetical protein